MSMVKIRSLFNESEAACNPITFPGGEPHVHIDPRQIGSHVWIDARVTTADEWMRLLAVIDAVKACRPKSLGLFLPYFPGARQDRRQSGFPFTLTIYANALRQFDLDSIVVLDPHSDVLAGMLPIETIAPADVLPVGGCAGVICPDAGAERRAFATAKHIGTGVIHARKHRDSATGQLSGFSCDPMPGAGRYFMVDDICDGGGTFVGLMRAIERKQGQRFSLYVSHGIFSKGLDGLLEHFDTIWTTDSWPQAAHAKHIESGRLVVVDLLPIVTPIMQRAIAP